jgi:LPS export ABC transporter permease LptF
MRLLTRYILREVFSHALLGGVLFTFVLLSTKLRVILETVVRNSASLADVTRLILYFLPEALVVTIPMAVLVGILLGLSRLAADSEITAMRASGMGAFAFVRIVSIVSIVALALGLYNSLYVAPRAVTALLKLQDSLKYAQASFEVEPRVFDEDFKNLVLYVQDVRPGSGAALWRHVFLADLSQPGSPLVTTADQALVTSDGPGDLRMILRDGSRHENPQDQPDQYNISTFTTTDLPLQSGGQEDVHLSRNGASIEALPMRDLIRRAALHTGKLSAEQTKAARPYRIELNKRFSYPFACLVLMLVGVPLGMSSKRGGQSTGFVLTILLVVIYYVLSLVLIALASQGKLSPTLGVWGANLIFSVAGALLLQQMSRGGVALSLASSVGVGLSKALAQLRRAMRRLLRRAGRPHNEENISAQLPQRLRSLLHFHFPLILDEYIMRIFSSTFGLVLTSFTVMFLIFTFFELIGDMIRNRTPLVTVGEYLLNLIPYILYNVTPLCVLVAVLITFGGLARSSEFTAMKAAGVSLYRVVAPVLVLTAVVAVALFAFDESYLPAANRRQEALRNIIKGKPAQTFLRPDRKWISGQTFAEQSSQSTLRQSAQQFVENARTAKPGAPATHQAGSAAADKPGGEKPAADRPGESEVSAQSVAPDTASNGAQGFSHHASEPARIFYYQFFDPDKNIFANLTVFEIDPATFQLKRRIFASSARWDARVDRWIFEKGWVRTFSGETISSYQPFLLNSFPEIREQPQYFKKEDRQSQEMSFNELARYIDDLRQSGFDTRKLTVQLNRKLAYPAITLVMAMLAIPFALSTGKRGGVAGFAMAILLAVAYLGISSLFEAMGGVNTLPPPVGAWAADVLFAIAGAWFLLRTAT